MAKRTRYPNRSNAKPAAKKAPGRAAPAAGLARTPTRPDTIDAHFHDGHVHAEDDMPLRSSAGLTEAEERRAAELEAEATARERAAIAESLRRKARGQAAADGLHDTGDINAPLSVRAAHEYAYVSRDVKRIALTASLMIAILAVLHILVNVLGVISL
jgi:hypothetical protein